MRPWPAADGKHAGSGERTIRFQLGSAAKACRNSRVPCSSTKFFTTDPKDQLLSARDPAPGVDEQFRRSGARIINQ